MAGTDTDGGLPVGKAQKVGGLVRKGVPKGVARKIAGVKKGKKK